MLKPKVSKYRVVAGDCLWNIAEAQYGNPTVWPEIAQLNKLPDPDLILIGMTLKLGPVHDRRYHPQPPQTASATKGQAKSRQSIGADPQPPPPDRSHALDLGPAPKSSQSSSSVSSTSNPSGPGTKPGPKTLVSTGTAPAVPVMFPAVRYKLDDLSSITISTPTVDMVLRLIGEISLQRKGAMSEVELSQRGTLTGKLRADYDSNFANLIGQAKVGINSQTHAAQVSCNLAVAAKLDGQVFAITQYEYIPPNRFKYSYKPRPIQGEWNDLIFSGNVGFELEVILKRPDDPPPAEPIRAPEPQRSHAWAWVVAGALVVAGAAIIVADVAKDVGTLGFGLAESPLSFAAASALFAEAATVAP